jgi:hypothetical protein
MVLISLWHYWPMQWFPTGTTLGPCFVSSLVLAILLDSTLGTGWLLLLVLVSYVSAYYFGFYAWSLAIFVTRQSLGHLFVNFIFLASTQCRGQVPMIKTWILN